MTKQHPDPATMQGWQRSQSNQATGLLGAAESPRRMGLPQGSVDGVDDDSVSRVKILSPHDALTLGKYAELKLALLCEGLGLSNDAAAALARLRQLTTGWSQFALGSLPVWQNDITDDSSPFEFSVAFHGTVPSVRVLLEAQESPMNPLSPWRAGLHLNDALRLTRGVSLTRFDQVRALFEPSGEIPARFSIWHAASLAGPGDSAYKIYLNPQIRGPGNAKTVVREALECLQMHSAWEFLSSRVLSRNAVDHPLYFSLDLSSADDARVKVYVAHPDATAEEIDSLLDGCRDHAPGDATRWINQLMGASGPFGLRPILTCFSFAGSAAPRATVHVPVRCYARSDADALEQACGLLTPQQSSILRGGLQRVAARSLEGGRGIITYVSVRRMSRSLNVTTYIAPEAYTVAPAH